MTEQQKAKQVVRKFMRENYSDERLAMLLAHAIDGKLSFHSCCCFVGVSTALHALKAETIDWRDHGGPTYLSIAGGDEASHAYNELWEPSHQYEDRDAARRRVLIPIIRAEMKRRSLVSQQTEGRDPVCTEPAEMVHRK